MFSNLFFKLTAPLIGSVSLSEHSRTQDCRSDFTRVEKQNLQPVLGNHESESGLEPSLCGLGLVVWDSDSHVETRTRAKSLGLRLVNVQSDSSPAPCAKLLFERVCKQREESQTVPLATNACEELCNLVLARFHVARDLNFPVKRDYLGRRHTLLINLNLIPMAGRTSEETDPQSWLCKRWSKQSGGKGLGRTYFNTVYRAVC